MNGKNRVVTPVRSCECMPEVIRFMEEEALIREYMVLTRCNERHAQGVYIHIISRADAGRPAPCTATVEGLMPARQPRWCVENEFDFAPAREPDWLETASAALDLRPA